MNIEYTINAPVSVHQFVELLRASALAERRPVDDAECIQGMVNNADLLVTAWCGETLVGAARSVTDFSYACYLSDLAVHRDYQRHGLGREMINRTQAQLGRKCKLILLAAPDADTYYEHVGFTRHPRCWLLTRDQRIKGQ